MLWLTDFCFTVVVYVLSPIHPDQNISAPEQKYIRELSRTKIYNILVVLLLIFYLMPFLL